MQRYQNGWALEEAFFGHRSGDFSEILKEKHKWIKADFGNDMLDLINRSKQVCPDTELSYSLYDFVFKDLKSRGVDPEGLVLIDALDTRVDWLHYSDGAFYLPSRTNAPSLVVTFDLFKISAKNLVRLRRVWQEPFGKAYSLVDFQNDIFRYKGGLSLWKRLQQELFESGAPDHIKDLVPEDLRVLVSEDRPGNHLILTSHQLDSAGRQKVFAGMVVDYFTRALSFNQTAQQSH